MKQQKCYRQQRVLVVVILGLLTLLNMVQAAVPRMTGDWQIKMEGDGQSMPTILSLSQDDNGTLTGKWISVWGASDLSDLSYTDNTLRFTRTSRFRDQETTRTFVGQIKKGALFGVMSRDTEESKITGERVKQVQRPVGTWNMQVKVGDQEYMATLQISSEKQGELIATWQGQWGEHEITDVTFKNPDLTFKRHSKIQDRQWESVFTCGPRPSRKNRLWV